MHFFDGEAKQFIGNIAVAGATAAVAKTATAPLERVKLLLQNQDSLLAVISGQKKRYNGIVDCLVRLPKEQGFWSLWRGNGLSIVRYFPTQAFNFAFNDFFKKRLYEVIGHDSPAKSTCVKFLSGGLAGGFSTAIIYPLEFCQTRITVDIGSAFRHPDKVKQKDKLAFKREFRGLNDCFGKVRKADGVAGLYKGFCVAVVGVTFYRSLYFGLFDIVKKLWANEAVHTHHDAPKPPFYLAFVFAQIVTCVSGGFSYPLDTVGRRLMMESGRPEEQRLFKSTMGAFRVMYKREGGVRTFYKGIAANCLRGTSGALVLAIYDEVLYYTKWKDWASS